ncbi:MAG: YbaK/EbsC family protein [Rubrivivax sp.]|nr:YbaK/EbsC family protein [Rubrivivax sp.]
MNGVVAYPEGFQRVQAALRALGHAHEPLWLQASARTSQEAAQALGVTVAQIAKSVVFRRAQGVEAGESDAAVLVVTSGDKRVDEQRVAALVCREGGQRLARADAEFVKARTGFSIGGVAPLAHREPLVLLIDRELFRFEEIWAAAGHPNGVFKLAPADLPRLTGGAPVADVVQPPAA